MAGPDGALGVTFKSVRILQAICILCVIGLTSNFVSQIINSNERAPQVLIGTLSVVSKADTTELQKFSTDCSNRPASPNSTAS